MREKDEFKTVTMYECKNCGRLFKSTRHVCKFNPKYKNCFSCKHCLGIDKHKKNSHSYEYYFIDVDEYEIDDEYKEEIKNIICRKGNKHSLPKMSKKKWDMQCPDWQIMDDYKGKSTYIKNVVLDKAN